jgi:hypothetical protein
VAKLPAGARRDRQGGTPPPARISPLTPQRWPSPRSKAHPPSSAAGAGARLEALGGDNGAVVVARPDVYPRGHCGPPVSYPLTQRPGAGQPYKDTRAFRCSGLFRQHISWTETALLGQFQPQTNTANWVCV